MSEQLKVTVKSNVGDLRVTREVSIPGPDMVKSAGRFIYGELAPNRGARKTIPEKWQQGDSFYLTEEEMLVIQPPEGREYQQCSVVITSDIDVGLICSDTQGCWRIFVVPTEDTGTDAPADVNVSIIPNEQDPPPDEEDDPPAGSN